MICLCANGHYCEEGIRLINASLAAQAATVAALDTPEHDRLDAAAMQAHDAWMKHREGKV